MALIVCGECGNNISDAATQCPSCGIKLKNTKKKTIITFVVFLIGILSSAIGLFQFFSVETFPVIKGEFCLSDNTKNGRLIELVNEVSRKSGDIIYFDNVRIEYACNEGKLSAPGYLTTEPMQSLLPNTDIVVVERDDIMRDNSLVKTNYRFNFDGFLDKNLSNSGMSEAEKAKYLLNPS